MKYLLIIAIVIFISIFSLNAYADILTLKTADVANLGDTYISNVSNSTNYGSSVILSAWNATDLGGFTPQIDIIFMKWNLTSLYNISDYLHVEDATLFLKVNENGNSFSPPGDLQVFEVTNETWTEDTITWLDHPPLGSVVSYRTNFGYDDPCNWADGWCNISLTDYIRSKYANNKTIVSFAIAITNEGGGIDRELLYSKEASEKPVLNITYSASNLSVSTCQDLNQTGKTYYLTADINANISAWNRCLDVKADNITIDCQGHTVHSTIGVYNYGTQGIGGLSVNNVTIKNCVLTNWWAGIDFWSSSYDSISNISGIENSNLVYSAQSYSNISDINSTANGAAVSFVSGGNNNVIKNLVSIGDSSGLSFDYCGGNNITNTSIKNSYDGISSFSGGQFFENVSIVNSTHVGIALSDTSNNNFINVSILESDIGISFSGSSNNNQFSNSIISNNNLGVSFSDDSNSNIFYNNLFNNSVNVNFTASNINYWNTTQQAGSRIYSNGTQTGGNYWTNSTGNGYSDTCIDAIHDGFCGSAYNVSTGTSCTVGVDCGDNIDYHPYSDEYLISTAKWFENISYAPSIFNSNIFSQFNITWNTTSSIKANISKVFLESNYSGSPNNYSMTNDTYGGDIFDISAILPVGTYYWKSYANTTENIWNTSDTWYFNISKNSTNPVHLNISSNSFIVNSTDANVSAYSTDTVSLSCWNDYLDSGTCNIYLDNNSVTNPYSNTLGVSEHSVLINTSGNTNYSSNVTGETLYIIVSNPVGGTVGVGGGFVGGGGGGGIVTVPAAKANKTANQTTTTQKVCQEVWTCSDWSSCVGSQQTRTCTDSNNCGTTNSKPSESQSCMMSVNQTEKAQTEMTNNPTGFFLGLSNEWLIGIVAGIIIASVIIFMILKKKRNNP